MQEDWLDLYKCALLEVNPARLPLRLAQAEGAIFEALAGNVDSHNIDSRRERQRLSDALSSLCVLRKALSNGSAQDAQKGG